MRITIIQGHPSPGGGHLLHALADAYAQAAVQGGHEVRRIDVAGLDLPLLRTREEWESAEVPAGVAACQRDIGWAEHLVILYPLWLGGMPAILKGFLEQVMRPGFAVPKQGGFGGLLKGRSARIVVTMGMPVLMYRWWFGAHSLKSLERNILKFSGISPVRESLFGMVEGKPERRKRWLDRMRDLGRRGR